MIIEENLEPTERELNRLMELIEPFTEFAAYTQCSNSNSLTDFIGWYRKILKVKKVNDKMGS